MAKREYFLPYPKDVIELVLDERLHKRIIDLYFRQFKTYPVILKILREEGWKIDYNILYFMIKFMRKLLIMDKYKDETVAYILESFDKIKGDYQLLYDRAMEKLKESDANPEKFGEWITLFRELVHMLETSMKRLGELRSDFTRIKEVNITVQQEINLIKQIQEMWFTDMEPELKDSKLIFHNPKPEIIDNLKRWRKKVEESA